MDDEQRRGLVSRIERGEYVTYELPKYSAKKDIGLALVFALIYLAMLGAKAILGVVNVSDNIESIVGVTVKIYPFVALIIFVISLSVRICSFIKKKSAIYNLGGLTADEKELILHGDLINAAYDRVQNSEKGSILKCNAEYNGEKINFESPAILAQFMPIKNKEIQVFINKNDPKKYLVNIYNHIPRKGPKVLTDKSKLQYESGDDEAFWAKVVLSIVLGIIILIFWPAALAAVIMLLSPVVQLVLALREGDASKLIGSAILLVVELTVVLACYFRLKKAGIIRRGSKAIRTSNNYLLVKVNNYWTTEYKVRGEHGSVTHKVHHISARYIEPGTNYVYDFFTTGPQMISKVNGKEIRVYVNPDNMNKYYVDYISGLRERGYKYSDTGFTFDQNGVWYEK